MRLHRLRYILSASNLQTRSQRHRVLDRLRRTAARRRQERVRTISDLNDPPLRRIPVLLRIAPPQLKVDDGARRRACHQIFHDRRPLGFAGNVVHLGKDFFRVDHVVPGFCFVAGDLGDGQRLVQQA